MSPFTFFVFRHGADHLAGQRGRGWCAGRAPVSRAVPRQGAVAAFSCDVARLGMGWVLHRSIEVPLCRVRIPCTGVGPAPASIARGMGR